MTGRIVLDISTLYRWTTRDVGITRTERMLARRLLVREHAMFVRYDAESRAYAEVPLAEVRSIVAGAEEESASDDSLPEPVSALTRKRQLIVAAKRAVRYAEQWVPAPARADYWAAVRHTRLALSRSLARPEAIKRSTNTRPLATTTAVLRAGDVYVSVGLDWDSNSYAHLYALKRQVGFHVILTCYDLIPVLFPQFIGSSSAFYGRHFVDLLHTADAISCISRTSERDLEMFAEHEDLPLPTTAVIMLGADFVALDGEESISDSSKDTEPFVDGPFVLLVGTIEPRKNHRLAFAIWERLVEQRGEAAPKLVVVGRRGWRVDDLMLGLELNPLLDGVVDVRHDVSDAELAWLYNNCLFTMLTSFYEGWGLPVVESTAHGKVCVASDTPAVVEAGLGAAIHIDPFDQLKWFTTITQLLDDRGVLESHERRVREVRATLAERLDWDRYVEEMLALAEDVRTGRTGSLRRVPLNGHATNQDLTQPDTGQARSR